MFYIALKPCSFAGKTYKVGDSIPAEVVQPGAAKNLMKMGRIAPADGSPVPVAVQTTKAEVVEITIHAEEGDMPLEVGAEAMQQVFDVLTGAAADAEAVIQEMTDDSALILVHITDSRKTVKSAAEARAKKLNSGEAGDK